MSLTTYILTYSTESSRLRNKNYSTQLYIACSSRGSYDACVLWVALCKNYLSIETITCVFENYFDTSPGRPGVHTSLL